MIFDNLIMDAVSARSRDEVPPAHGKIRCSGPTRAFQNGTAEQPHNFHVF